MGTWRSVSSRLVVGLGLAAAACTLYIPTSTANAKASSDFRFVSRAAPSAARDGGVSVTISGPTDGIPAGNSFTLSWSSAAATSCSLSGPWTDISQTSTSGSEVIQTQWWDNSTRVYSVTCSDGSGNSATYTWTLYACTCAPITPPGSGPPSAPAPPSAPTSTTAAPTATTSAPSAPPPKQVNHSGPYLTNRASMLWCTDLSQSFCSEGIVALPAQTDVTMVCWEDASSFTGVYKSPRWFYIRANGHEGFVHSSWVQQQASVPACSHVPAIESTEYALKYAFLGTSTHDARNCLGFLVEAYKAAGYSLPGPYGPTVSAASWWAAQPNSSRNTSGSTPPRGALVFWGSRPGYPDGHAALSLGNGWLVSTSERTIKTVHTLPMSARDPSVYKYLGYYVPS